MVRFQNIATTSVVAVVDGKLKVIYPQEIFQARAVVHMDSLVKLIEPTPKKPKKDNHASKAKD